MTARPPVLAHERFVAEAASFAGLDLAERFERIHATNLWGAASSRAGLGSEVPATARVAAALPALLAELGARSLLDAPCGDTRWLPPMPGVAVIGVDIVPTIVAHAQAGGDFRVADITRDPLPCADVVLCRDCLVHLSFANIARAIANFRASGATWLLTTTFPDLAADVGPADPAANVDCADGDWRGLDFNCAPFGWPAPTRLLDEGCAEGDGGWADKSLGLWRLADL